MTGSIKNGRVLTLFNSTSYLTEHAQKEYQYFMSVLFFSCIIKFAEANTVFLIERVAQKLSELTSSLHNYFFYLRSLKVDSVFRLVIRKEYW